MNYKRIIGLVILVVGIFLIGYGINAKMRINQAKSDIDTFAKPFGDNPVGQMFKKGLKSKASQYDQEVMWLFISGATLIVVGGVVIILCKTKRKKK